MNKLIKGLFLVVTCSLFSCDLKDTRTKILIINELDFDRTEIVTISLPDGNANYGLENENGDLQAVQFFDKDMDGSPVQLLFESHIKANDSELYYLRALANGVESPVADTICFSRFVPERTDDYTWENDKVAFRTYGPTAQKMKEEGIKGGTLSSGIDCWLKKVEYPIINKWYKAYLDDPNAYHIDSGEGLDNFHVGTSRGCGGVAIKSDSQFYTSKNFVSYETKSVGAFNTSFSLDYVPFYSGNSDSVKIKKHFSLDKGSQLMKVMVEVEGADNIWVGLTLHENDGEVSKNAENGWVSYWQPHGDGQELATVILASPEQIISIDKIVSEIKDESHVYVNLKVIDGKATYYSGFTWNESGQFENQEEWHNYLNQFAKKNASPLIVSIE